ncbi:hypothetical protein [Burkholderia ubonensis]|nr:hypothetical protein [Burkholderia ubonensis]
MTSIAEMASAELARIEKVIAAKGDFRTRLAAADQGLPQFQPPEISPEAEDVPPDFFSAATSAATYREIWMANSGGEFPRFRTERGHIDDARAYVESLLDVDLSRVRIEVVPASEWNADDEAEGVTLKGGADSHFIFVPEVCDCYPTELLVHEFAHAGHFTAQRANDEYPYYWVSPVTAEFVAHFCQYNYLLEHRPRIDLYRALGQFVAATYALAIAAAHPKNRTFTEFIAAASSRAFKEGWPMDALEANFNLYLSNIDYFRAQLARGIAEILSVVLVDHKEGMRRFIRLDRIDRSLMAKLESAFPEVDVLHAYKQIDVRLAELLKRFRN